MKCKSCGAKNGMNSKFCNKCGVELKNTANVITPNGYKSSKADEKDDRNVIQKIVGIICWILLLSCIIPGIIFSFGLMKSSDLKHRICGRIALVFQVGVIIFYFIIMRNSSVFPIHNVINMEEYKGDVFTSSDFDSEVTIDHIEYITDYIDGKDKINVDVTYTNKADRVLRVGTCKCKEAPTESYKNGQLILEDCKLIESDQKVFPPQAIDIGESVTYHYSFEVSENNYWMKFEIEPKFMMKTTMHFKMDSMYLDYLRNQM